MESAGLSLRITLFAALALPLLACAPDSTRGAVHVATLSGPVNGVMERYVDRVLSHAEETRAVAVLFEVDTPGGQIGAMKHIAGRIEQSGVPVVTWVGPPGAQAASAGTFVVMAGHVAAMAPNTSIGAATPVTATGEDVEGALGRKVTNDTVAFARAVAEQRGRNADWAEQAIRDAVSATPSQAVDLNVVDFIASTRVRALEEADGRTVTLLDGGSVTLAVATAPVVSNPQNGYERVLGFVSNPAIVAVLLLIALAGLAIEFFSPGLFLPGAVGLIAGVLAFLGAGALLPGEAAIALLIVGLGLVAAEFFVPGGILGFAGGVALVLALAIFLGQASTEVSPGRVLLVFVLFLGAITLPLAWLALRYLAPTSESGTRLT